MAQEYIAIVDDESNVREAVCETLERHGSEVKCFASACECLEHLELRMCDLLITDVRMPGMDGIELLTAARRIAPRLPALIMTGDKNTTLAERAVGMGLVDIVEKPLCRQTVIEKVESLLRTWRLHE